MALSAVTWASARVQPVLTIKNSNYGNINLHIFSIFNFGTAHTILTLMKTWLQRYLIISFLITLVRNPLAIEYSVSVKFLVHQKKNNPAFYNSKSKSFNFFKHFKSLKQNSSISKRYFWTFIKFAPKFHFPFQKCIQKCIWTWKAVIFNQLVFT